MFSVYSLGSSNEGAVSSKGRNDVSVQVGKFWGDPFLPCDILLHFNILGEI